MIRRDETGTSIKQSCRGPCEMSTLRSRRDASARNGGKQTKDVENPPKWLGHKVEVGDHFYKQRRSHQLRLDELYDTNFFVQIILAYNRFVHEGILQAMFCVLTVFEGISCLMTFCFELTSLGDVLQNYNIVGIFLILEFFLAFSFRDTVKESNLRYIKTPTQYRDLLDNIMNIAKVMSLAIDERFAATDSGRTGVEQRYLVKTDDIKRISKVFTYVRWANFFSLPIFSESYRILPVFIDNALFHYLTGKLCDFTRPETIIEALMVGIVRKAGELRNSKVLDNSQEEQVTAAANKVSEILNKIRITKNISSPPMMGIIAMGMIVVFVLIVIPLQVYSAIGVLTPVFYPIIAVLFSSYFLFAYFYNDPFSPFTHYKAMDFAEWRTENRDQILVFERDAFLSLGYAYPPPHAWNTAS